MAEQQGLQTYAALLRACAAAPVLVCLHAVIFISCQLHGVRRGWHLDGVGEGDSHCPEADVSQEIAQRVHSCQRQDGYDLQWQSTSSGCLGPPRLGSELLCLSTLLSFHAEHTQQQHRETTCGEAQSLRG